MLTAVTALSWAAAAEQSTALTMAMFGATVFFLATVVVTTRIALRPMRFGGRPGAATAKSIAKAVAGPVVVALVSSHAMAALWLIALFHADLAARASACVVSGPGICGAGDPGLLALFEQLAQLIATTPSVAFTGLILSAWFFSLQILPLAGAVLPRGDGFRRFRTS